MKSAAQHTPMMIIATVQSIGEESPMVHPSGNVPAIFPRSLRSGSKRPIAMKLPMNAKNILNEENTDFSLESSVTTPSIAP